MRSSRFMAVVKVMIAMAVLILSGCQGILSGVYDSPDGVRAESGTAQISINASDWLEWQYINIEDGSVVTMNIPTQAGKSDSDSTGIYTYWYDIFGMGICNYKFREFCPSERQPEPASWTFAVHRNNVRTNGGAVCETSYTSFSQLPEDPEWSDNLEFVEDEWNQTDVWAVQDRMLSGIIGSQGIRINKVLSGWLGMVIPPMPPVFIMNNHIFILRLANGTYMALQLADYMNAAGTKCYLTINYRYPL